MADIDKTDVESLLWFAERVSETGDGGRGTGNRGMGDGGRGTGNRGRGVSSGKRGKGRRVYCDQVDWL